MTEFADPPNFGVGSPTSEAASAKAYCVGVKNGLLVTWFTNQNCHAGVFGKLPAALPDAAVLLLDVHAASSAEAAAVALTSPVPVSSFRRVGPSFMLSVWIASSTLGSTSLIAASSHIPF